MNEIDNLMFRAIIQGTSHTSLQPWNLPQNQWRAVADKSKNKWNK